MRKQLNLCIAVAAASAVIGLRTTAHGETYSFVEPFNAPPLTAGTADLSYEDGWNDGDNGWIVAEANAALWGQRSGVAAYWPGGTDNQVGTVRHRDGEAPSSVTRSFGALSPTPKPLSTGNVSLKMQNILIYGSRTELTLYDAEERTAALTLRFGESGINQDALEVAQVGGAGKIVSSAANNLRWSTQGFSSASGSYGMLSIDFDANLDRATVTVSSVNPAGGMTSAAPVIVPFQKPVSSIGQVRLTTKESPNAGQPGSLLWLGEFGLSGQETRDALDANADLKARLWAQRRR